jgi:hypothetical protein
MSFSTSLIEFTNLTGVILKDNSLLYDITYTITSPTDITRCDDDTNPVTFPEHKVEGVHLSGIIPLPEKEDETKTGPFNLWALLG